MRIIGGADGRPSAYLTDPGQGPRVRPATLRLCNLNRSRSVGEAGLVSLMNGAERQKGIAPRHTPSRMWPTIRDRVIRRPQAARYTRSALEPVADRLDSRSYRCCPKSHRCSHEAVPAPSRWVPTAGSASRPTGCPAGAIRVVENRAAGVTRPPRADTELSGRRNTEDGTAMPAGPAPLSVEVRRCTRHGREPGGVPACTNAARSPRGGRRFREPRPVATDSK